MSLRVAMIAMHTSPLATPGTGDAGGLNVYVSHIAGALADLGCTVEIFTRATSSTQAPRVVVRPGVAVRHIEAGPFEALEKGELPGQLCAMTMGVQRSALAAGDDFDVVHSHYWLSGQVGWLVSERWGVPLVHTMHTTARGKNAALGEGEDAEPQVRELGEASLVAEADGLIANTATERDDLIRFYDAEPGKIHVVHPGVDTAVFAPRDRGEVRAELGLPSDAPIVVFAGRIQPHKGTDLLIRALAHMEPDVHVVVSGGPSGKPTALRELKALAHVLGVAGRVEFRPPMSRLDLATLFAAADVVAVPSRSETFGLVAAEALATGTPVVASDVGGLRLVVIDGEDGLLVSSREPQAWAEALTRAIADGARLHAGAVAHRDRFSWGVAGAATLDVYRSVLPAGERKP